MMEQLPMKNNNFSSSGKHRTWAWIGLCTALAVYVVLSVRHIRCPGLGYDEVMWASVAISSPDSSWTSWRIGRWPVLLALPYIGAVKGYLYAPILELFGATPLSIRLPMILLGAAGIALTFASARRALGITGAVIIAIFLAINPEIVQRLRHDLGPAALDFVLRAACLLLLLRYAENERSRDAVLFWLLACIGVWQKLTFIWYINAYVLAFILLRGKAWIAGSRKGRIFWSLMPHFLAYLAVVGWVGWVYVTFHVAEVQASLGSGAGTPHLVRIETLGRALGLFFQGVESIEMFHEPFVPKAAGLFLTLFLGFIAIGILRGVKEVVIHPFKGIPFRGIVVVAALAITVQLTITTPADKVWHRLSLEPFATWLAVDGLLAVAAAVANLVARPFASSAVSTVIVCFGVLGNLAYMAQIHRHLDRTICAPAIHQRSCNRAIQTMAIWQLLDLVSGSNKRFVFLDWGIRNQALLMTREPDRLIELPLSSLTDGVSGLTTGSKEAKDFAREYFTPDGRTLFVLHGPEYTCIPATRDAFFNLVQSMQIPLRLSRAITENGSIAFEVWEVAR
jgi:Dolichyl-phosphate-mannose-protein mannosyltransferase